MSKEEKQTVLSAVCVPLSELLRVCGGRWKGVKELAGEVLLSVLPSLSLTSDDSSQLSSNSVLKKEESSASAVCLFRHTLSERLPLDSTFIPHQKEKGSAGGGGGGKKAGSAGTVTAVSGQWLGGTTSGATPSAVAAAKRLALSGEGVLSEWEKLGLTLCLETLTCGMECGSANSSSGSANSSSSSGSGSDNNINYSAVSREHAAVAVHTILLNRSRRAQGEIITAALASTSFSTSFSTSCTSAVTSSDAILPTINTVEKYEEDKSNVKKEETGQEQGGFEEKKNYEIEKSTDESGNNDFNKILVERLFSLVSSPPSLSPSSSSKSTTTSSTTSTTSTTTSTTTSYQSLQKNTTPSTHTNFLRLMAAKVLDVWHSAGGGIPIELLSDADKLSDANSADDNSGQKLFSY